MHHGNNISNFATLPLTKKKNKIKKNLLFSYISILENHLHSGVQILWCSYYTITMLQITESSS